MGRYFMSVTIIDTHANEIEARNEQLNNALQAAQKLEKKWLVGHDQINLVELPDDWQTLLSAITPSKQNMYALILSQQQQLIMHYPSPEAELVSAPDIPTLALPCITTSLRPLFSRVMTFCKQQTSSGFDAVLNLLASRGVCAHPADWMPTKHSDSVPSIYLPWVYWSNDQLCQWQAQQNTALEQLQWDDLYPAEKRARLTQLRHTNPQLAAQYIHQVAKTELAENRLRLYHILSIHLSHQDQPQLQEYLTDKSKKVVAFAKQLLARLAVDVDDTQSDQHAQELAPWLEVKTKGLFKKTTIVLPAKLKSKTQQAMRTEFIAEVSLAALAKTLNISVTQLCNGWQFDQYREQDNIGFINNAFDSLPETTLNDFITRSCDELFTHSLLWYVLRGVKSRLSPQHVATVIYTLLEKKHMHFNFGNLLSLIDSPLTELTWQQLSHTQAWAQLQQDIKQELTDKHYLEHYAIMSELLALGLFLPQALAQRIYDGVIALGVMPADPMLDALKLNVCLVAVKAQTP